MSQRIIIEPTTIRGDRGQRYRVYYQGAVLLEDCWNPEFTACRELAARGVTGRLEVWRPGAAYPAMIVPDIEVGARWTVVESDKEGPVIKRWVPYPDHLHQDAVSASTWLPPAAVLRPGVG